MIICDCERSHNGLGLAGRECDCHPDTDRHDPNTCGNCSPITGECILGCKRWLGECRKGTTAR